MRPTEKLYWSKVLLAVLVGVGCAVLRLQQPSPIVGILFSITVYVLFSRYSAALFRFKYEEAGGPRKVYTQAVFAYFLTWIVTWILVYTFMYPPLISPKLD